MLTTSQSFKLYGIVQRYFNKEEDAQAFVSEIETAIDRKYEDKKSRIASKDDLMQLEQKIKKSLGKIRVEIREQKAKMIKWMFIFWANLLTAIIAWVMLCVKK